jgi:polyisoprenoid-binding protein YceI
VHYAAERIAKPEGATVHYVTETKGSTITLRAFATGLLSALGHNPTISIPDFEGEILVNTETIEQSSLRITFRSSSLTVVDDISEKDRHEMNRRMHDEVLESDSFADIVYECMRLSASKTGEGEYWAALNGELSLHGVTRNQPVSARVSLSGDKLRAMGEVFVRQSDYEIRPVSALGGSVKLKDELKMSFDITARKQP